MTHSHTHTQTSTQTHTHNQTHTHSSPTIWVVVFETSGLRLPLWPPRAGKHTFTNTHSDTLSLPACLWSTQAPSPALTHHVPLTGYQSGNRGEKEETRARERGRAARFSLSVTAGQGSDWNHPRLRHVCTHMHVCAHTHTQRCSPKQGQKRRADSWLSLQRESSRADSWVVLLVSALKIETQRKLKGGTSECLLQGREVQALMSIVQSETNQ